VRGKLAPCSRLIPLLLLALLLCAGCGEQPSVDPAQFVGTWEQQFPEGGPRPPYEASLVLRPDGSGTTTPGYEPHPQRITWLLYRGKLVLTPRNATRKTEYEYRFNSPDELVLVVGGEEAVFKRAE
jgi:hypothetical protein